VVSPTRVVISGAQGRMGQALLELLGAEESIQPVGLLENEGSFASGACLPVGHWGDVGLLSQVRAADDFDVLIDFSTPLASLAHLNACAELGKAMVIGTTGFDDAGQACIREAARQIPIMQASNYSLGVAMLMRLAQSVSASLGQNAQIEIVEMHHHRKVDAPSGTALSLLDRVQKGLGQAVSVTHGREGQVGPRSPQEIGMHALRGGDVVGEHSIIFAMEGERLELVHKASSRSNFAQGALACAKWLADGQSAGLYGIEDLLGTD